LEFALQRLVMKTVGRLSDGIRLGWKVGFDSGAMLDYVYENRPRGITPLGRWIDRQYLESIGWRGIRQRKVHLEQAIREAVGKLRAEGRPVRVLDIATGHGRYVLEALAELRGVEFTALLRDWDPRNVEAARESAQQMNLPTVICAQGDAFDRQSLASIQPPPTIAIVSGLYELFPDNVLVARSLAGLSKALRDSGYLVYTNQPWHPQVEMIARVLTNREGKAWIMRCRPQREMDLLVGDAGFEKVNMHSDDWGIFTVSLARRPPEA
jgi:SAM-dependent methyltransferase